jgi:hypothetical protein
MRSVAFVLILVACAPEPGADRDYTLTACPSPAELAQVTGSQVCDRGVGFVPRFRSWDDCFEEARGTGKLVGCSHPNRDPCPASSPHLFFCSYASIAAAGR